MNSAKLIFQDWLGDAIKAQLVTDGLTAGVSTNPKQGDSYPYIVIGEDAGSSEDTNRDQAKTSLAHNIYVHSDSQTECKQVAASVLKVVGVGGTSSDLGSDHYEVSRELETDELIPEFRPEGDLYNNLIRVRFLISHRT